MENLGEFLQRVIDSLSGPVFIREKDGRILDCNEAFAALLGRPKKDILGKTPLELHGSELARRSAQADTELLKGPGRRARYEARIHACGRGEIDIEVSKGSLVEPASGRLIIAGMIVDVTSHKRAAKLAEFQSLLLRAVQDASLDGILVVGGDGEIITANKRFFDIWKIPEELRSLKEAGRVLDWAVGQIADPEAFLSRVQFLYAHRREKGFDEIRLKNGRVLDRYSSPIFGAAGAYVGRVWYFRDVTASRSGEKALKVSEERYRTLVESSSELIWAIDRRGIVEYMSPRIEGILGYKAKEVIGRPSDTFLAPDERPRFGEILREAVDDKKPFCGLQLRCLHKLGHEIYIEASVVPVLDPGGQVAGFRGVARDISEQKASEDRLRETEAQFRQAQKMEAVGRLAGGVAHDFNNLLTAILGYCVLLQNSLSPDDPRSADLKAILEAANSAASLTRQLLAFSRRQVIAPKVINLNEVLGSMEKMLKRLIGEDIELGQRLEPELANVLADPGQIEQVVMNLAVNSRDAMPRGGRLLIETHNVRVEAAAPGQHGPLLPGGYVQLIVSDTGCGMDAQTQSHLFEPFFTTKEAGKGTGLGLSTVYGIVRQAGGNIYVYSEPGRGTAFKVYLPATSRPLAGVPAVEAAPDLSGRASVLLVEDEEGVRGMMTKLLKENGYRVLCARNGEEALALAGEPARAFDIVVSDLVMPKIGGRELLQKLRELRPGLPAVLMSGYTEDSILSEGGAKPGTAFLQKPMMPRALLLKIREQLAAKAPA